MRIKKNIFIFIAILLFCSINKRLSSEIKNTYTILSNTQTNSSNGNFEAIGNVKIKGEDNFSASFCGNSSIKKNASDLVVKLELNNLFLVVKARSFSFNFNNICLTDKFEFIKRLFIY